MELLLLTTTILILKAVSALPPLISKDAAALAENERSARRSKSRTSTLAESQSQLLPLVVNPESYVLRIQPILEGQAEGSQKEWTAPGYEEILMTTVVETDNITFHKDKSLSIERSSLEMLDAACEPIEIKDVEENANSQTYTVKFSKQLLANKVYTLSARFVAEINDVDEGLFRLYYSDSDGKNKPLASSKLEWTEARRVYPCFDEPRFRATYKISIARKEGTKYFTLSNAAKSEVGVAHEELPKGWVYDHYEETVRMPSYLVAITVTDFAAQVADPEKYSKPVTIYANKDSIARKGGVFLADTTASSLTTFEKLFEYPYELSKMDSISHSVSYYTGIGMEDWGMITYREEALFVFPGETLETIKALSLDVTTHEVSHQWFGNLITCKYWSHFWVNEGFTSYMSYIVSNIIYPLFDTKRHFLWYRKQNTMAYDVGLNYSVVNLNDYINDIPVVKGLTYSKGASIVRMMEGFLGFDMLFKCFQAIFKRYAYESVVSDELYEVMQKVAFASIPSGKTIKGIMDTWVTQPGYPLIKTDGKTITQEPFVNANQPPLGDFKWEVPLTVVTKSDPEPKIQWLHQEGRALCQVNKADEWVILNHEAFGFFRVMYDEKIFRLIEKQLIDDHTKISGLSRSQLIDDYFKFVVHGHIKITKAMDLLKYLPRGEEDYIVWFSIFENLLKSKQMVLYKEPKLYQSYLGPIIDQALKRVKWEQGPEETGTNVLFRTTLVDWACAFESKDCLSKSKDIFKDWKPNPDKDPFTPDRRPILSCAIVGNTGQEGYDFMLGKFTKAGDATSKRSFLISLCCTKDKGLADKLISQSLDTNSEFAPFVQDVFVHLAGNSLFTKLIFTQIQEEDTFQKLKSVKGGVATFWEIVTVLSDYVNEDSELAQIKSFLEKHHGDLADPEKTLTNKVLGKIQNNIKWMKEHYDLFRLWLISQSDIGR